MSQQRNSTRSERRKSQRTSAKKSTSTSKQNKDTLSIPLNSLLENQEKLTEVLEDLRKRSEPALHYTTPTGREYVLVPFDQWTFFQNLRAAASFEKFQKDGTLKKAYAPIVDKWNKGTLTIPDFVGIVYNDPELFREFFHLLYVPAATGMYDESDKAVEQAKKDMMGLRNEHTMGALYHFFISAVSFFPSVILTYFQASMDQETKEGLDLLLMVLVATQEERRI